MKFKCPACNLNSDPDRDFANLNSLGEPIDIISEESRLVENFFSQEETNITSTDENSTNIGSNLNDNYNENATSISTHLDEQNDSIPTAFQEISPRRKVLFKYYMCFNKGRYYL